ncbi:MAG: SLC13 family permease [Acidimicrobiales bacterium]
MHLLSQSLSATWAPFVLIVGLLFVGHVAAGEGLFEYLGSRCARLPGSDAALFVATMLAVALVTALLNLDTSVVFMTPVALQAARSRSSDESAFLYGTVLMSNSASLVLIGSNLTNLLVFARRPVPGFVFAEHMVGPWLIAVAATILFVGFWRRSPLRAHHAVATMESPHFRWGPGVAAVVVALVMMLALSRPALPVFILGAVVEVYSWCAVHARGPRETMRTANPTLVVPLFVLAVLVGWLGRSWAWPSHLVAHASSLATATAAGLTSIVINNLPAASLFAGRHVAHPYALLLGLDLGPNLFMTGAMSTLLWFRIAKANGAQPRSRDLLKVGVPLAVVTIVLASLVV